MNEGCDNEIFKLHLQDFSLCDVYMNLQLLQAALPARFVFGVDSLFYTKEINLILNANSGFLH